MSPHDTEARSAASTTSPVPESASVAQVLRYAAEAMDAGLAGAMATVVQRHGSTPSTPGQKLFWRADGCMFGTIGGGAVEREVLAALRSENLVEPVLRVFKLGAELGMCCGGRVELLLEPLLVPQVVLIVGAGHVGRALATLLCSLDFRVLVADPREGVCLEQSFGQGMTARLVRQDFDEAGKDLAKTAAVLVMTHDHQLDQEVLK